MSRNQSVSVRSIVLWAVFCLNLIVLGLAILINSFWLWAFLVTVPILLLGLYNILQKSHTILNNFPVVGYFRYLFESIRPELRQYFWESDLDGKPFNRRQRSLVYQRAKNVKQTVAFGMQEDPGRPGHEWAAHSIYPVSAESSDLRVTVGNRQCKQPYNASILNVGAMSYGALSKTAVSALNEGALLGDFAQNTGEGGISNYHLRGGDLIWQIGTGYFGCRKESGEFDEELFKMNSRRENVKMIELKLSQGAKPGHGGILPGDKNTPEIAAIRNVVAGTTVYSPPGHTEFRNAGELIDFIQRLRILSGGKPVGFKLCIGDRAEFIEICKAITLKGVIPDFITIDGSEGGTGAAPLEFTDNLGMPLYDALAFASRTLEEYNLKGQVRLIAAGKIITAFDIMKALALGASLCYSARGMMFSLGCIQALSCDNNRCPAGIATQDPKLYRGLDVNLKKVRVANFHRNTIRATIEMMEACGFGSLEDVRPDRFFRKIDPLSSKSFDEIYFKGGRLVKGDLINPQLLNSN